MFTHKFSVDTHIYWEDPELLVLSFLLGGGLLHLFILLLCLMMFVAGLVLSLVDFLLN